MEWIEKDLFFYLTKTLQGFSIICNDHFLIFLSNANDEKLYPSEIQSRGEFYRLPRVFFISFFTTSNSKPKCVYFTCNIYKVLDLSKEVM